MAKQHYKKGDTVRVVNGKYIISALKPYATKELTVDEDDSFCPELTCNGKRVGCEEEKNLIPSNAVIHTKTQGEYDRLMEELEKVGYRWNSGHKPTNWSPDSCSKFKLDDDVLSCTPNPTSYRPIIPFTDIFKEEKTVHDKIVDILTYADCYPPPKDSPSEKLPEMTSPPGRITTTLLSDYEEVMDLMDAKLKEANNKPMLNKLTNALKKLLSADKQTLYRAGYINGGLELTGQGRESYINNLFNEEGDHKKAFSALVKEAEEIIKQEEDK